MSGNPINDARLKAFAVAMLLMIVAACSTSPRRTHTIEPREPSQIQHWQASGRIAVSGAAGGGSGSFNWSQQGADAQVQMRGPIGMGSLRLTITDRNTHIDTGDGQSFDAKDADAELAARLGAAVPVQNLRYWLMGVAAPGAHEWLNLGDTATLTQAAWRIEYQHYAMTDDVRLPTKLVAVSGSAKVRIVIDRWRLQ